MPVHLSYSATKTGSSHLSRHSCKFSADQSNIEILSSRIPQRVKDEVTKACVSLCCKDIRPFDIVTDSGFADYSQSLIKIGSLHGNLNVKDLLPHPTTISRNTQKEAEKLRKSLIPTI
jgi:BRCT domain type II-containing protein